MSKRNFEINDTRFAIVNSTGGTKYDLMIFDEHYQAWKRLTGCNTIEEGHELAENHISFCNELENVV